MLVGALVASQPENVAASASQDYCKQGAVAKAVFEAFFNAMSDGDVARARGLLGSPPEFLKHPLGTPVHGRMTFTIFLRKTPKIIRKEVVLIDVPRSRDRWLRQHAAEQFTLTDWTVGKERARYLFPGLSFLRRADDLPGGSLVYGAKGGVDCKRRRIIALGAGANYYP